MTPPSTPGTHISTGHACTASAANEAGGQGNRRRHRTLRRTVVAIAGVAVLTGIVIAGGLLREPATTDSNGPSTPNSQSAKAAPNTIEGMTSYLSAVPGDWVSWSALGQLQLEHGRATADPAFYARADASFSRSLQIHADENYPAVAGRAALAAARHDFYAADQLARAALAVNPLDPGALGTLTDALTELGRYPEALRAAHRLDDTHPGVSSFTRLAYQAELRGDISRALSLLRRAAEAAATPAQVAFARYQEGILALSEGRPAEAARAYRSGIASAPGDTTLLHLQARLARERIGKTAQTGDAPRTGNAPKTGSAPQPGDDAAVNLYRDLVARRPAAAYAVEFADLLSQLGRTREASDMITLAKAQVQVARANGIAADPGEVLIEAKYGDPAQAVALGRELWTRQQGVYAAEALAMALHAAGANQEALQYADKSVALGTRTQSLLETRKAIRASISGR